jgi:hypothetical protein
VRDDVPNGKPPRGPRALAIGDRLVDARAVNRVRPRDYWCDVMAERVSIRLVWRFGRTGRDAQFVQCNQVDCQYAEDNQPPCPLSVVLFVDELKRERE